MSFNNEYIKFWQEFGESRTMVLSTSLNDRVTSRNMSMIILDEKFYFQTDKTFQKYEQLNSNPLVALCVDNIQIEGKCKEIGTPSDHIVFLEMFKKYFASSFKSYSYLDHERLFVIEPISIQRWIYKEDVPYIEKFNIVKGEYSLKRYLPE